MTMTEHSTDSYASNATYAQLGQRLKDATRIALFSHSKADGDSLGSMLAVKRALHSTGRKVDVHLMGPIDDNLLSLTGDTPVLRVESLPEQAPADDYDVILVVDTGAWSQLEPVENWLRDRRDRVLGIDHHAHGDDVASLRVVDSTCASTTQMIVSLLDEMNLPLTGGAFSVAEALFLGLATDTGWFRHSNAGSDVFAVAARLLACDVDKTRLHQTIEESHRPQRLGLEARALASLTYACNGTAAVMSLSMQDFSDTGGSVEDLTGMVNMPLMVKQVMVAVLLAQSEDGRTKASFRSKSSINPTDPDEFVDVNELAQRFGGGGHVHAAGAKFDTNLPEARAAIIDAIEQHCV